MIGAVVVMVVLGVHIGILSQSEHRFFRGGYFQVGMVCEQRVEQASVGMLLLV